MNVGVFTAASISVIDSYFTFSSWDYADLHASIERSGWIDFLAAILLVGVLGTIFDLISLSITLHLLERASHSKTSFTLAAHLGLDIVIAVVACLWAYGILDIVIRVYYEELWENVAIYASSADDPGERARDVAVYLRGTLSETLNVVGGLWSVIILVGFSAALPTVVYLLILIPILALRAVPTFAHRGLSRVVFLVTTDKQPVLRQISVFSSNAGGMLGAIVAWSRLPPL